MPALEPVKQIFELLAPIIRSATVIGSILGAALEALGEILLQLSYCVAKIAEILLVFLMKLLCRSILLLQRNTIENKQQGTSIVRS